MTFRELLESSVIDKISNFSDFCATLSFYIEYNEVDELPKYMKELKSLGLLEKKKAYRLVRAESEEDAAEIRAKEITSACTKMLKPDMIEEMKDMIDQYKSSGDYYCLEVQGEGLDVNKFYNKYFKGKQKELSKTDVPGNQPIGQLYDTFKEKYAQNEFIIFGSYTIKNIKEI
jgi:hypothetical protein